MLPIQSELEMIARKNVWEKLPKMCRYLLSKTIYHQEDYLAEAIYHCCQRCFRKK